jgi:hypothetical protein
MAAQSLQKPSVRKSGKKPSVKKSAGKICGNGSWTIVAGALTRPIGAPGKMQSLFKAVGEKIPFEFLNDIKKKLESDGISRNGVYIAHDSMGYPRYIGRGNIFGRLDARRKAQVLELSYFSFFVVEHKMHEREIETIMIRAAGPLLDFNNRKVRNDIQAGDIRDFEAGTKYVERQYKKGKKSKKV